MKFWVKAVVDNNVSEQLLLQADSIDELRDALAQMLRVSIASLSITDFQSQVVDRLRTGVEIITVWIHSQPALETSPAAPSHLETPRRDPKSASFHGYPYAAVHSTPSPTPKSGVRDVDGSLRGEESLSGLFDGHANPQPATQQLSRRSSWRDRATPRDDAVIDGPGSNFLSLKEPIREPCVAKLCLRRDDVIMLLDERFDGKYNADLLGCFVRAKEPEGYGFYRITDVVDGETPLILLDTVYSTDSRQLDTISNAPPTTGEVRAWFRKMLASARQIPSFALVEAKAGDIESGMRAARSALGVQSPTSSSRGEPLIATVHHRSPSGAGGDGVSPTATDPLVSEPTRASYDTGRATVAPDARRRRKTQTAPASSPLFNFFHGKSVLRTNDCLNGRGACLSATARDDSRGTPSFWLFVQRHANTLSKKTLGTDTAMSAIELDTTGRAVSDTDVTSKGFEFRGAPCLWDGLPGRDQFLALAWHPDTDKSGGSATGSSSSTGSRPDTALRHTSSFGGQASTPFTEEGSGRLVQRFCILRGPALDCLRWKDDATALLPLPMWAQNEGHDPHILLPTLVSCGAQLHAFYLVVIHVDNAGVQRSPQPVLRRRTSNLGSLKNSPSSAAHVRHVDAASLSPTPSKSGATVAARGVSPQHRRHSSLMAQFEASASATPFDDGADANDRVAVAADEDAPETPPQTSLNGSFGLNAHPPGEHTYKYALAHAFTTDSTLQQWTIVNNREPIVYTLDEVPLYTIFSLPPPSVPSSESDDAAERVHTSAQPDGGDRSTTATTLGLAWWDSSCAPSVSGASVETSRQSLGSASRLPLLCFAYHPVEVPATDPYGRSRRGSSLDWVPVMLSTAVPGSANFEDAESITISTCTTTATTSTSPSELSSADPCFVLSVVGRSRRKTQGSTFHTFVSNTSVMLTHPKE